MAKNDIGGFFVSLGLNPDKNSFETGNKLIDAVTTSLNKLIGTARNAAVVLTTTAIATGSVESANYKTATKIGLTTEKLNELKAAAKIAGVNADGLVGSVGKLANVMNRLTIDGSGLEAFSQQLAELGMGVNELMGMDPDQAFAKIIETAQGKLDGTNMTRITTIVGDILGDAGADFFVELERQGKTIDQFMAGAAATQITTTADNQNSQNFAVEVRTIQTKLESISKKLGAEVGKGLMPIVEGINSWLDKNGSTIITALENIGNLVGIIAESSFIADTGKLLSATVKLLAGDKKGALAELESTNVVQTARTHNQIQTDIDKWLQENGYQNTPGIYLKRADISQLPAKLQKEIEEYNKAHPFQALFGQSFNGVKMKDGIMRPDGTVTQVAPDDWVFAARNVSDLAKAFIPAGMAAGGNTMEYSIVQNFTITGSNDIPQVIKQQAYRGTQEGLLAVLDQSSRRLQMMSGTR